MEYESKMERFKRHSGLYALKTFIFGFLLILAGIISTFFLSDNKWPIILSVVGLLIVLWAVSEGKQEDENF